MTRRPPLTVPEAIPNGIRVRLNNLPKKKNIHRDLKEAFKSFSEIINIIPAVMGNKNTRERICKGFAFVDFKSEKEANRFVDIISTEPITFGKVEKQIRCEIMKSSSPNPPSIKAPVHGTKNSNPVTEILLDSYVEDAAFDTFKNVDENGDEFDNVIEEKDESEMEFSEPLKKRRKLEKRGRRRR
ncbi:hypothetical protein Lser_V15G41291 [Lactuca serriola]